jgi:hypothetical protein
VGSGGQREDVSESGVTGIAPHLTRLFGTVTPEPDTTLTLDHRRPHRRLALPRPMPDEEPLDTKRIRYGAPTWSQADRVESLGRTVLARSDRVAAVLDHS